jgi:hypothetical protein
MYDTRAEYTLGRLSRTGLYWHLLCGPRLSTRCVYVLCTLTTSRQVGLRIALNACARLLPYPETDLVSLVCISACEVLHGTSGLHTRGSPQCVNIAGSMYPSTSIPTSRHHGRLSSPRFVLRETSEGTSSMNSV